MIKTNANVHLICAIFPAGVLVGAGEAVHPGHTARIPARSTGSRYHADTRTKQANPGGSVSISDD